ncbi:hypothetical protein AAG906_019921 [Vitis piasezkii]
MSNLYERFDFKQHNSSMYNAPANGLAEAFNKTLCNLLKKIVDKSKRDWHEQVGETLWAYRTTYRTPTQATPYFLIYGVEVVLPLSVDPFIKDFTSSRVRSTRRKATQSPTMLRVLQARLSRVFNKKVRLRSFQVGDLVLSICRPIITTHKTGSKFTSKWDGPYVVQEVYTNGAYKIVIEDGLRIGPINGKFLKRYYG